MMKQSMKRTLGWLVVAAALTIGMAACSSDADSIAEPTIQEPAPTSLHITVGAGIADDNATTRAEVVNGTNSDNKPTHTLVFTTGDRLFFRKMLENGIFLTGWLTMDGSPSSDGLSATFSGTVKPYNLGGEEISYNLSGIDPLAGSNAYLMPSGAAEGCFSIPNNGVYGLYFNESYSIAKDVNTLMKTALYVEGSYDDTQQRFNLTKQYPILNCALGGLTPNTAYTVKLRLAGSKLVYELNDGIYEIPYASTVTTDAGGNARFAISGNNDELTENRYWIVQLSDGEQTKDYVIGQKQFESKVYNLTQDVVDVTVATTASFGLKFSAFTEGYSGMNEVSDVKAQSVTISGSGGRWTVTPTEPATYFSRSTSGLTAEITVVSGETLIFTAEGVSYEYESMNYSNGTFRGSVTVPSGEIGATLNLGTVTLTKQQ